MKIFLHKASHITNATVVLPPNSQLEIIKNQVTRGNTVCNVVWFPDYTCMFVDRDDNGFYPQVF
jgi:hypothetical protein